MIFVVVELHAGGVVAGLAIDKIADGGVFYDHFRPEWVTREPEKI